jgi:rare lipoprotein A
MLVKHRNKQAFSVPFMKFIAVSAVALSLAACGSSSGPRLSGGDFSSAQQKREFGAFKSPKYGKASPKVVDADRAVPKGGGRYHVGKPYRIAGKTYRPFEKSPGFTQVGSASWYGAAFHGRKTANGEVYDMRSFTAAHTTMPLPSYARVTNVRNGYSIVVRVNDRGPYHGGRIIDVSQRTAEALDFKNAGTGRVKVEYLGKAGLGGSDDRKLLATLSRGGAPAAIGTADDVQVASAPAPQPVARRKLPRPEAEGQLPGLAPENAIETVTLPPNTAPEPVAVAATPATAPAPQAAAFAPEPQPQLGPATVGVTGVDGGAPIPLDGLSGLY